MQDCMPQRSTYPEEVEANGEVRLPVAVPVPGLLEQGHQHTARHLKHPALLGLPDRQQELRILPKGVWGRTKQGETAPRLPSHVVPQATERYTDPGHLPQIPTQRSIWTESRLFSFCSIPTPISPLPPQVLLQTHGLSVILIIEAPLPSTVPGTDFVPRKHFLPK